MTLKIAVVGCGKIADGHIEEIKKLPQLARVVAVCDREPLMAEQIALRYDVPAHYDDFSRMLATERPDVVHITTPPQSHLPLALEAMDAGAHPWVEKPFTMNLRDSERLLAIAQQKNRKVSIGYTFYFDPPALDMRQRIAAGEIGDVVHVESFFGYGLGGPFGKALMGDRNHWVHKLPGKLFHNNIDHLLNKAVEFVRGQDVEIVARGGVRRPERFGDERDLMGDELRVMMMGERTTFYGTFSSHIKPTAHYVRVFGTRGSLHADFTTRTVTSEADATLPSAIGRVVPAFTQAMRFAREGAKNVERFAKSEFHYFSGLQYLIRSYYESIVEDGPVPIPYEDILRISGWLDEIWRQLAMGETPKPPAQPAPQGNDANGGAR